MISGNYIGFYRKNQRALQGYYSALTSPTLDTSDFILISAAILEQCIGKDVARKLTKVQACYLRGNYAMAIKKIVKLCMAYRDRNISLLQIIDRANQVFCDDPVNNLSRRYFESKLAQIDFSSHDDQVYRSVELLSLVYCELNSDYAPKLIIESSDDLEAVLTLLHGFGDFTATIVSQRNVIKDLVDDYINKDRGGKKTRAPNDMIYSTNPGIMKSTQPNYPLEVTPLKYNRIVDLFHLNLNRPGYSANHRQTPFVNSASGTVFTLVVTLAELAYKHKDDYLLQNHVDNITKAWFNFACINGFHSFAEILDVLHHPEVQAILTKLNLKLDIQFSETTVATTFRMSADYAKDICLKSKIHDELINRHL